MDHTNTPPCEFEFSHGCRELCRIRGTEENVGLWLDMIVGTMILASDDSDIYGLFPDIDEDGSIVILYSGDDHVLRELLEVMEETKDELIGYMVNCVEKPYAN